MSYSRSYHETITVHGSESKTVSYPKSESGGSMTVTVHYTEHVPVDIDIHVDTNPFDRSVGRANKNVNFTYRFGCSYRSRSYCSKNQKFRGNFHFYC